MSPDEFDALTELCAADLVRAFKLPPSLKRLAWMPARRFAGEVRDFDDRIESHGLRSAGDFILNRFTEGVEYAGLHHIPTVGPLVLVANHPGMTDAMAVWAAIPRLDLKIIAADRDLLQLLANMRRHLITIQAGGSGAMREALGHLKAGGCLLTFPAGHIEPDATIRSGACESLASWSPSVIVLAQRVVRTQIVPVFVKGVISPSATRVPLLKLFRAEKDRDWAAATLQIVCRRFRDVKVSAAFGAPVTGDLACLRSAMQSLMSA